MIFVGGDHFFGRQISWTATTMHPFSSTFGWTTATPRQLQRPYNRDVMRVLAGYGLDDKMSFGTLLVVGLDFFTLEKSRATSTEWID